jgi:hypothetical protein
LTGDSYRAKDLALFDRIASVIHREQPSTLASYQLWAILSDASERRVRPHLLLLPVFDALPALRFVEDASIRDRAQLARGAGMILAVITAHLRALEARHPHSDARAMSASGASVHEPAEHGQRQQSGTRAAGRAARTAGARAVAVARGG